MCICAYIYNIICIYVFGVNAHIYVRVYVYIYICVSNLYVLFNGSRLHYSLTRAAVEVQVSKTFYFHKEHFKPGPGF